MHRSIYSILLCSGLAACEVANSPTATPDAGEAAFARAPAKESICHYDARAGMYSLLPVPPAAVASHLAHGDVWPGASLPDNSGVLGADCRPIITEYPGIHITMLTNGTDNNAAPGLMLPVGSTVTWMYIVTNTGNVPLSGVVVMDDNATPDPADDFSPDFTGGDSNANGWLDPTETWTYTTSGSATPGPRLRTATVTADSPYGTRVQASDVEYYH